jgi:hypothetical protein
MLGWRSLGEGANRGQRVLALLLQCCMYGVDLCWPGLWVKVCSSFLEGNEELGAKNALLSVGLSASCMLCEGAMGAVSRFMLTEVCSAKSEYGAWRLFPDCLFMDCRESEGMHMAVYRSRGR